MSLCSLTSAPQGPEITRGWKSLSCAICGLHCLCGRVVGQVGGPHGGVWLPPQRIWEKKKEHLNPQIMDFDGERRTLFRLAYRLYMLIYCTWFVWDSTWNQICGLKLSRPCLSCIHGCYDMSCYYVLFRCICFIQFHPATSDTVVTDDLCSHGLGWSSKILPRCHFVGGFWINITLDLRIMFFFRW